MNTTSGLIVVTEVSPLDTFTAQSSAREELGREGARPTLLPLLGLDWL